MNKKEQIHAEADRIFNGQKENYSVTEMVILVQSQYYNIEDLFTYGANLKSNDANEHISISEEIFSICNSFQNNLKLIPDLISWEDAEIQISRVKGIKSEISLPVAQTPPPIPVKTAHNFWFFVLYIS